MTGKKQRIGRNVLRSTFSGAADDANISFVVDGIQSQFGKVAEIASGIIPGCKVHGHGSFQLLNKDQTADAPRAKKKD